MNIKDAYIHNGDAILKDIQLSGSKLQKLKAGKNADDTYLGWETVCDLSPFGASGHNHDDRYVKLNGASVMTGDLTLHLGDLDRFIVFSYPNTVNPTSNSWRTGVLGTEQGENNFFVVQYQKVNTNSSDWNTAFKIGQDTGTVTFTNNITIGDKVNYHAGNLSIKTLMGTTAIGDSDEPVYWNGSSFVKAGAYPTKASWNYDDIYLKLSGGNLTGKLTIKTNNFGNQLALDRGSDDGNWGPSIMFYDNGTFLACLGVDTSGTLYKGDNGSIKYAIYHAGNLTASVIGNLGTLSNNISGNAATATKANSIATEQGTSNVYRNVFFAYNGDKTKVVYDDDFMYNPGINTLKIGTGTLTATNYSGNAATATKIGTSTVGSATMPVYINSGTPTAITSFPEAYLSWGGKNFAASYGPIDAAMIPDLGACRSMFANAAGITVQYSRDGGATWVDYGLTDTQKTALFSVGQGIVIGGTSDTGIDKSNYKSRIIVTTNLAYIYTTLNKIAIFLSTNGSTGSNVTIDARTKANVDADNDTWVTLADSVHVNGWSGWNIINIPNTTTYGNQSSFYQQIRFTFGVTSHASTVTYGGLSVSRIMMFGGMGHTTPSNMAKTGHLYSFDASQNATFPAAITATMFKKSGGTSTQFLKADGSVDSNTYSKSGHTHTKSQITDFPSSLPANGGYANEIASKGILDSQEKIDNFITANRFEYATFNTTDANNVGFNSNDGKILSIPYYNTDYGVQIAFDNTGTSTVKVRGKAGSWGNWYTLLHSGNYTTYTVKKDGTGASGTWGISITGTAGSVSWENVTGKPNSFTPSSHTHSYTTIESCTTLDTNSNNFSAEYAEISNSVTTKPSGVDAFGVIKLKTASGWYGQILLSSNEAQGLYYRTSTNLSSSVGWQKLLDTSNYNSYVPKLDGTGATGTWGISVTGNAATATKLQTARTIWGQSFDGTKNISGALTGVTDITANGNINLTSSEPVIKRNGINIFRIADTGIVIHPYSDSGTIILRCGVESDTAGNKELRIIGNGNVGIGTTSPSYKLHVVGDIYTTTGFKKKDSSDSYVLLGGGGHKLLSDFSVAHDHPYLPLSGGTMSNTNVVTNLNADLLDGYHAGVTNGSVGIFVPWPNTTTLKNEGLMPSEYGTSEFGNPDEVYLQSICKWAIAHYTSLDKVTLIGAIAPNTSGTCIINLYSSGGNDSTTLLPRYCSGIYITLNGNIFNFGTYNYTWYYHQVSAGYASSAGSATTSTYASNVGSSGTAGTNYVTASKVISACNWYDTMIGSDSDTVINRWSEIVSFVAGFKETPDLATFLNNNYLAKAGGTMTGPLKWANATALPQQTSPQYFLCIDSFTDGGTTKYASKEDTLKALTGLTSTAIGDSDEPVYWNGAKFVKAGAYPTKSSWNYDDKYLKLTGGTLSGDLAFSHGSSATDQHITWTSGTHYQRLKVRNGKTDVFIFQYSTDSGTTWSDYFTIQNGTAKIGSNIIYHSGNLPAYPTVNNGALYLQANGTTKVTFTANQSDNSTLNIATGSSNGTISVGGTNVSVKGLGSNAYSSTAYLPLAGGTMDANAQIKRDAKSGSWIYGRDNAIIRETSSSGYHPLFSLKTKDGSWELGEYNTSGFYNVPIFSYVTDTDYSNGNNTTTYQIKYPLASGTIALTADLKWSNISSKPETATRWPSWSEVTNKPTTISGYGITDALKIDGSNGTADGVSTLINKLSVSSSDPTDADYYVCQYAEGGTTTTTYHRRPMSAMWNWIKTKTNTLYPTKTGSGASGTWGINVTGSAKYLVSNASKNIGGLSYYYIGGSTFNTTVDGSWSGYSATTNYNSIVRLQSHTGTVKYYIDLIFDVNNSEIYYRRVTNNNLANIKKLDVYEVPESTASYSLSNAAWTNTITLPTTAGSYILNIVSGNSTLTGVFSIGASDNAKDEISLHLHGNGPRLYARTNGTTLQLSSNDASATSRSVTIKYRRMI